MQPVEITAQHRAPMCFSMNYHSETQRARRLCHDAFDEDCKQSNYASSCIDARAKSVIKNGSGSRVLRFAVCRS